MDRQLDGWPGTHQGKAADLATDLDGFKKKTRIQTGVICDQSSIGQDGRELIRHETTGHRHHVMITGHLEKGISGRTNHDWQCRFRSQSPYHVDMNTADPAQPVIELRGLSKTYSRPDGTILVEALKPLDLKIPRGQYMGIMGASGSGKSTLMNLLGALDQPTSGQYRLDGSDIAALDDEAVSLIRGRKIGFVFQSFNLIPELTIAENVEVPLFYRGINRQDRHEQAVRMLSRVGLGDRLGHRPTQLSGGQQQRVAVARALVGTPSIILADEPTGNLDSATGRSILDLFDELHAEGLTIIMVTHDENVAGRCDRVLRLADGSVASDELQREVQPAGDNGR